MVFNRLNVDKERPVEQDDTRSAAIIDIKRQMFGREHFDNTSSVSIADKTERAGTTIAIGSGTVLNVSSGFVIVI